MQSSNSNCKSSLGLNDSLIFGIETLPLTLPKSTPILSLKMTPEHTPFSNEKIKGHQELSKHCLIHVSQALSSIFKELLPSIAMVTPPSTTKQCAHLRFEKHKLLSIKEFNLKEDIQFINLLTTSDIAKLTKKCSLLIPEEE